MLLKMYLEEIMTNIVGLCCAINHEKGLTIDSCIYRLFLTDYKF